jgi:hypothetical protein
MHARRTRDRWPHYWPDRPLRPIDGQTGSHVSRDAGLPSLTRRHQIGHLPSVDQKNAPATRDVPGHLLSWWSVLDRRSQPTHAGLQGPQWLHLLWAACAIVGALTRAASSLRTRPSRPRALARDRARELSVVPFMKSYRAPSMGST